MKPVNQSRRRWIGSALAGSAVPWLAGCAAPLPVWLGESSTPAARALLEDSAQAHGVQALERIDDVSVGYEGQWRAWVGSLQPALVDPGFRADSQERLLTREGLVAQAFHGASGRKQVVRRDAQLAQGDVKVWYNGELARDAERRAAAALVADGYALFLLGPMLLARRWSTQRSLTMELGGIERVGGRDCDTLRIRMAPGLGLSGADQLALFIDREQRLMRGVRFSLDGLPSTVGAVAQVDTSEHVLRHGVRWPTRFSERLLRPVPIPVHDWRLAGLDVNRGLTVADLDGVEFSDRARAPAALWPEAPAAS